jgi:hypothetical protein
MATVTESAPVVAAIQQALRHGWYTRTAGTGLLPYLTNAPPGQEFCRHCGGWVPDRNYDTATAQCVPCKRYAGRQRYIRQQHGGRST